MNKAEKIKIETDGRAGKSSQSQEKIEKEKEKEIELSAYKENVDDKQTKGARPPFFFSQELPELLEATMTNEEKHKSIQSSLVHSRPETPSHTVRSS